MDVLLVVLALFGIGFLIVGGGMGAKSAFNNFISRNSGPYVAPRISNKKKYQYYIRLQETDDRYVVIDSFQTESGHVAIILKDKKIPFNDLCEVNKVLDELKVKTN